MKQRNSEVEILEALKGKGYDHNLIISDGQLFVDEVKGQGFEPRECTVDEEYRFEGMTNPSDMSIIYAVSTPKSKKGTVVVGYGPHTSPDAAEFFRKVNYAVDQG